MLERCFAGSGAGDAWKSLSGNSARGVEQERYAKNSQPPSVRDT